MGRLLKPAPMSATTLAPLLLVVAFAAACGSSASSGGASSSTSTTTSTTTSSSSIPSSTSTTGLAHPAAISGPPPVPGTGAYLGAWLQPVSAGAGTGTFSAEQQALPGIQAALGRPLALLHVYSGWQAPAPVADLDAIEAAGSIPILDWGCAPDGAAVVNGSADQLITAYAQALKSFGRPVLLRWCWEMNLAASHPGVGGPTTFVASWRHIWGIFHQMGVANVAFVWCPAISGRDPLAYYPGDDVVDWIGVDGYDHTGTGTFSSVFGSFYAAWSGHGKPMIVAETGSPASNQVAYLQSIGQQLPAMPVIKGVVYFDALGPMTDWRLGPAGLQAFAHLAAMPYFVPAG